MYLTVSDALFNTSLFRVRFEQPFLCFCKGHKMSFHVRLCLNVLYGREKRLIFVLRAYDFWTPVAAGEGQSFWEAELFKASSRPSTHTWCKRPMGPWEPF